MSSAVRIRDVRVILADVPTIRPHELGLSQHDDHVNRHGGAIALCHPLGMSGARLLQTAAHQLQHPGKGRALVRMCIGVGQGLSIALEAMA